MSNFLNVGFEFFVNSEKIRTIAQCNADKLRREIKKRQIDKTAMTYADATNGKEVRSMIVLDDNSIVVSALAAETLIKRNIEINGGNKK